MSEPLNDPDLHAFAADLQRLVPATIGLNRDQLMFRAGQESVQKQRRLWMLSSGTLAAALLGVSILLVLQMSAAPVERVKIVMVERAAPASVEAPVKQPHAAPPAVPSTTDNRPDVAYLPLRKQMLRSGVDAVPEIPPLSGAATSEPTSVLALRPRATPRSLLQWFTGPLGERE